MTQHSDLREKCGVFGVFQSPSAAHDIYLGLHAQQHRGQESAGIVTSRGPGHCLVYKDHGLVSQVFDRDIVEQLDGQFGIGHVRYSTSGGLSRKDIQPLVVNHRGLNIALAHNGNITNAAALKEELEVGGSLFTSSSDSEVLLHRIVRVRSDDPVEQMRQGLRGIEGAYSLVLKFDRGVAAVRDPHGFRPLHVGRRDGGWYFASETCAFDILDVETVGEVAPGEGWYVDADGPRQFRLLDPPVPRMCAFEVVYFSRPDSLFRGRSIHQFRIELGRRLFEEHPAEVDAVIAVPDSSNSAALGFAQAAGVPLDIGLIRSHYTGRTFIAPGQSARAAKVKQKFNVVRDVVEGRRVAVVDDSIVRGTTCRQIVKLIREHGATAVHFRVASPMVSNPCYYGIDMPTREEFLVNRVPHAELARYLTADSVGYLSPASLRAVVGADTCRACFTGEYPVPVDPARSVIQKHSEVEIEHHAVL